METENWEKESVREKQNYRCLACARSEEELGHELYIRHLDRDKSNNDLSNLIGLCKGCGGRFNLHEIDFTHYEKKPNFLQRFFDMLGGM